MRCATSYEKKIGDLLKTYKSIKIGERNGEETLFTNKD